MKVELPNRTQNQFERIEDLNDDPKNQGERFTRRIAKSLKNESWGWWVIELAWTAGPATFVALSAAYFIGYGKAPASELIIYFVTYTLITAIMAIVTRVLRNASTESKEVHAQKLMLRTANEVFRTLAASRDAIMKEIDDEQRRIVAATVVLKNPEATEVALAYAVEDLTGSPTLAQAMQRIESYRHLGMSKRIEDELKSHHQELEKTLKSLQKQSPQAVELLEKRFNGHSPEYREGLSRYEGFLQRSLAALDKNNLKQMSDYDVFDSIYLVYEMLNGRRIAVLHAEFRESEDFTEAKEKLDRARSLTKQAIHKRNSRLKSLASDLQPYIKVQSISTVSFTSEELMKQITEGLKNLRKEIDTNITEKNKSAIPPKLRLLKTCMYTYDKAKSHQRRADRYNTALNRLQKTYDMAWLKYGKQISLNLSEKSGKRGQLNIREDFISLTNEQMYEFADKISKYHAHLRQERSSDIANKTLSITDFKQISLEYLLLLKDFIAIDETDTVLSIETSKSANFYHIDINDSARYKMGAAQIAMEELQQNRRNVANRLARNLREYYRVALNDDVKEYFVSTYGASMEYLNQLNEQPLNAEEQRDARLSISLKMPNFERTQNALIKKAREAIKK